MYIVIICLFFLNITFKLEQEDLYSRHFEPDTSWLAYSEKKDVYVYEALGASLIVHYHLLDYIC